MKKLLTVLFSIAFTACLINISFNQIKAEEIIPNGTFTCDGSVWTNNLGTNFPHCFEKGDVIEIKNTSNNTIRIYNLSQDIIYVAKNTSKYITVEYEVSINNEDLKITDYSCYVNLYDGIIKDLRELLYFVKSDGTRSGILVSDNDYLLTFSSDHTLKVNGTKTIDLNGKTIKAVDDYSGDMFYIDNNASLTINDSKNAGIIDGGYTNKGSHDNYVRGFYIYKNGKLILNNISIKNMCADPYNENSSELKNGGAIYNQGTLEINGGSITNCIAHFGGAIFSESKNNGFPDVKIIGSIIDNCSCNELGGAIANCGYDSTNDSNAKLTISNTTIKNCSAGGGGAVANYSLDGIATTLIDNDSIIKNCEANSGGAIINQSNNGKISAFKMNGLSIENCIAEEYGGAICSQYGYSELANGIIKDCKSDYSAIFNYGKSNYSLLYLNGNLSFDNKNDLGVKDDIYLYDETQIVLGDSFSTSNKIGISYDLNGLGKGVEKTNAVYCNNYSLGENELLKDTFISINGQEYLTETYTSSTDHSLSFKSVQIISQPTWPNYDISTDKDGTPISIIGYQWYQQDIMDEIQIQDVGHYSGDYLDFTVTNNECSGTFDTNKWINSNHRNNDYLIDLEGLKEGEVLSFDYSVDADADIVALALNCGNMFYNQVVSNNKNGKYKVTVPHDGSYSLYVGAYDNNGNKKKIETTNITVKHSDELKKIISDTSCSLKKPVANSDLFCRVTFKNDDGYTSFEDSDTFNLGKVLEGNNQNIIKGTKEDVTIKFDATSDEFTYLTGANGAVYLDGTNDLTNKLASGDYAATSGSIVLTLKDNLISSLSTGTHTIYIKKSDVAGKECSVATLNIVNPTVPSNSTSDRGYKVVKTCVE